MKFLVLWELQLSLVRPETVKSVMRMPAYSEKLKTDGKLISRYHIVGKHGGAWLYEADSNEELERLLAASPVYNYAHFQVLLLADMDTPAEIVQPTGTP